MTIFGYETYNANYYGLINGDVNSCELYSYSKALGGFIVWKTRKFTLQQRHLL
ncbi:MAG: hypothetical protein ACJAX4_002564 [Clostridium sp.]|jgi:hypothetical protein